MLRSLSRVCVSASSASSSLVATSARTLVAKGTVSRLFSIQSSQSFNNSNNASLQDLATRMAYLNMPVTSQNFEPKLFSAESSLQFLQNEYAGDDVSRVDEAFIGDENCLLEDSFENGIFCVKRTFNPSLKTRHRTHGFLIRNKHSKHVILRRRAKGRKRVNIA